MPDLWNLYCRGFQTTLKYAQRVLPWRIPKALVGEGAVLRLPGEIRARGLKSVLLVTDEGITKLGLAGPLLAALAENGIAVTVYDKTQPNPTIANIEEAVQLYCSGGCEGLVAFGGGSPMDCAKGVGARIARPGLQVPQMKGLLKILVPIPPLFAVPTTAGTGSEATLAAVITNPETHEKYPVNDTALIPCMAVLDPLLTKGLPPGLTATTGMDALTHAVEAYIGHSNTSLTSHCARSATAIIFQYLPRAYENGGDMLARRKMQKAALQAGIAFTRAYVGNVHAIAHTLGGYYNTPHGLANAVILPHVLEYYGQSAAAPLAELAELVGLGHPGQTDNEKAAAFIEGIRRLNSSMGIPDKIEGIREEDIPGMIENAFSEANPLYPVPMIFTREDFYVLYKTISA